MSDIGAPIRQAQLFPGSLRQVFEAYRDSPWVFLRPLGNWGDHLLYSGAERMADSVGLQWQSCETYEFERVTTTQRHCIYLQGGGGFNGWCSGRALANLEQSLRRDVRLVVQGPVSVSGDREWLAQRFRAALNELTCDAAIFYAREEQTLQLLRELSPASNRLALGLDHDTALSLSPTDLLEIAELNDMPVGRYDMVVLREDNEMPTSAATQGAATPAGLRRTVVLDPAFEAITFRHWLRMHLYARSITSNRLHSSIVGAVAGKPIQLSAGSYHKNSSVWQYSLASRGVSWINSIEPPAATWWDRLPAKIRASYKIRRLRLALHGVPLS